MPAGCRKVSDGLKIVDNEADDYDRDDVPLSRVVSDPQLDIEVLKAAQPLPVIPWRVGKSAALRERNVVNVRGFPLGAFRADNVGKVISPFDHDEQGEWDHDDFVVDALLQSPSAAAPTKSTSSPAKKMSRSGEPKCAPPRSDSCGGSAQSRKTLRSTKPMRSLTLSSESYKSPRRSGGCSSSCARNGHVSCSRSD